MQTKTISEMSIRERMQYIQEQLAFEEGSLAEAREYLTKENLEAVFGEVFAEEDVHLLRKAAEYYLS